MFRILTNRHVAHFIPGFVTLFRVLLVVALALALFLISIPDACAKGFSGGRSFSSSSFSSSRSYSSYRPTPAPRPQTVINKTVVNRTTVVQSAPVQASSGGFFSTFAGSMAGSAVGSWLFAPKAPAPAPQPVAVDCSLEANKVQPVCQPKP